MTKFFKGAYRVSVLYSLAIIAISTSIPDASPWLYTICGFLSGIVGQFSVTDND